ncbi:tRNA (guanosine(46)-N7)-methyltransferase TrmB [Cytophaga aurantiaca]|uniref:tRNA (guanosine(46)-N7)-methyltransferase TrmB n=1 Tax=Cytophaga aurantiaca TaxID=29530 RepID=UPI0003789DAB|nr:tRNA (guanosine(46)-N7)-methyltransferase TrmB [Cytophaga aurantiaca]
MARKKLMRFKWNDEVHNLFQPEKDNYKFYKGNWKEYFKNTNPIVLEVGCGRAEYTTGLAALNPDVNYIGLDIKGARLWKGSSLSIEAGLTNTAFIRTKLQNLEEFFEPGEVKGIWITFPDPKPRESEAKLRLSGLRFMNIYRRLMPQGGKVFFKTDNRILFDHTLEVLKEPSLKISNLVFTHDLYQSDLLAEHYGIQTTYEKTYLNQGVSINYLKFDFLPL